MTPPDPKPLTGSEGDYDELVDLIGNARVVLLGEASHGTFEFYRERALITRRLIEDKGFAAVAIQADWPPTYRVNRYLHGALEDETAQEALGGFRHFPSWMWRNSAMLDVVGWLRAYNDRRRGSGWISFYGLDLYSLYSSIADVIGYLDLLDPAAAEEARERYACFGHFDGVRVYDHAPLEGIDEVARRSLITQLMQLHTNADSYLRRDGTAAEVDQFYAEQNARLVIEAERYYSSMFSPNSESPSIRDRHMADTLSRLVSHLASSGRPAKVVVWAHNMHVGDARMTELSERGEVSMGQLAREEWGQDAVLVGFTTHSGTVTASSAWDAPPKRKELPEAVAESHEARLHEFGLPRFFLDLRDGNGSELSEPRPERAIGVVYQPETERDSHYFEASLSGQFDAVVHVDESRAVEPLERTGSWDSEDPPETYPSGF
ncbi:MAG TPA: erythromycin esterase family protein [Solirubrobacterales bacterium]|nr:erythromycin esterase family protein [Solirubrobacterales bacterium]